MINLKDTQVPVNEGLTFEDEPHIYRMDGIEVPSVSKIMEPLSNAEYKDIPDFVLANAAHKGSSVHESIENYIKYGIEDVEPNYSGYFDGFLKFVDDFKPEFISSELYVYHPIMNYAGTLDILAKIDDSIVLIDAKTTSKYIEKNVRIQLEAYAQALKANGYQIQGKGTLLLRNTGEYVYYSLDTNDSLAWKVFSSLKAIYDYQQQYSA